jgi:hypothetical protein
MRRDPLDRDVLNVANFGYIQHRAVADELEK